MIKVPLLRHQRYKSIPTHFPSKNQRQNVPETKMSTLTPLMGWACYGQLYSTKLAGRFDHSETILGPFKKLPFIFRRHRTVHTHCLRLGIVLFLIHSNNVTD